MRLRILAAKLGLDGHDSGLRYVAQCLSRAGMEVIYLGKYQTVSRVISVAVEEDIDVLALSFLSNEYRQQVPELMTALADAQLQDVEVVIGGLIPQEDHEKLLSSGVSAVFGAETKVDELVNHLRDRAERRPAAHKSRPATVSKEAS